MPSVLSIEVDMEGAKGCTSLASRRMDCVYNDIRSLVVFFATMDACDGLEPAASVCALILSDAVLVYVL